MEQKSHLQKQLQDAITELCEINEKLSSEEPISDSELKLFAINVNRLNTKIKNLTVQIRYGGVDSIVVKDTLTVEEVSTKVTELGVDREKNVICEAHSLHNNIVFLITYTDNLQIRRYNVCIHTGKKYLPQMLQTSDTNKAVEVFNEYVNEF